ncbi:MAG: 16S rRNA (guanine(966)-N(2))-methyltransferase RsmD [Gammaproteobacteria bacterium]|nr:16S rRNA (guanine(966)-N(2))-methyltransferase RsmD [Gammaproteobacteria bacterium]
MNRKRPTTPPPSPLPLSREGRGGKTAPSREGGKAAPAHGGRNELRIIAGEHRGRRLKFPDGEGLRPTPDRVRETVFNWLAAWVPGAHALDLFAGSGALGFEALSRGAESVTWVELNPAAAAQIEANVQLLRGQERGRVLKASALAVLEQAPARAYDLVFLDPPFGKDWLPGICARLEQGGWLAEGAFVYVESEAGLELAQPESWQLAKDKSAGQVQYRLYRRLPKAS